MTAQELLAKYAAGERNFVEADLSEADLSGAKLSKAILSGAYLSGANLSGVDLSGADLSDADLGGANLSNANLSYVNLNGANLSDVNLSGANLTGTISFNIAFRHIGHGYVYSFITAIDFEVVSFEAETNGKPVEIKDGLGTYIGYVKHGKITEGTNQFGKECYYTKAEPLDVSTFEFKGTVFFANESSGSIEMESSLNPRIDFENKDLDPSFQGKITEGTVVKFKLSQDKSFAIPRPCAINIRPY